MAAAGHRRCGQWWVWAWLWVFGLAALGFGLNSARVYLVDGERLEGRVTGEVRWKSPGGRRAGFYSYQVEVRIPGSDEVRRVHMESERRKRRPRVGERVGVLYDRRLDEVAEHPTLWMLVVPGVTACFALMAICRLRGWCGDGDDGGGGN